MSRAEDAYRSWLNNPYLDAQTREELEQIKGQTAEIEDRFYQDLQFGTAGLRGILGAGSNRMNVYTVAAAAEGFARLFLSRGKEQSEKGIAISYDSRHFSREFAELSARIFAAHGLPVYFSDELRPVPLLSFAIRHFGCGGGIMITASHNPREYNGFKVYGDDGGQLPEEAAAQVAEEIRKVSDPMKLLRELPSFEAMKKFGMLREIGPELDEAYDRQCLKLAMNPEAVRRHADLKIVYSPLHGCGNKPVRRILAALGFNAVEVVPEQELPDGDFPTAPYPNPEFREAMEKGIELAEKVKADLLIATDPDADRMGLAVRTAKGDFVLLSGNEIGCLLMDYILGSKAAAGQMPEQAYCVTTVVSSRLPLMICEHYGVRLYQTLTGFKNIAEVIHEQSDLGQGHFQFAYEESFGYLTGLNVRDKDAVVSSMLIAEMAAVSAAQGETLYERLQKLFQRFRYASEKTLPLTRKGREGLESIAHCMKEIRADKVSFFDKLPLRRVLDYQEKTITDVATGIVTPFKTTASNVLVYELEGLDWFACRPSGTEPKLKIYMGAYRTDPGEAEKARDNLADLAAAPIVKLLDQKA